MSSHEPAGVDDGDYVNRAIEVALVGVREAADQRDLGELIAWGQRSDDDGTYLRIDFASGRHDRQLVRYERRILSSRGADKDAETAGMIFGSAFEERLLTREAHEAVDADGTRYLTLE